MSATSPAAILARFAEVAASQAHPVDPASVATARPAPVAIRAQASPLMSSEELAIYIRALPREEPTDATDRAAYWRRARRNAAKWARTHGVSARHRGRRLLFARAEVDAALARHNGKVRQQVA